MTDSSPKPLHGAGIADAMGVRVTGLIDTTERAAWMYCSLSWPNLPGTIADRLERLNMEYRPINFRQKFALFKDQWKPKVVAEMNEYQFKVVKLEGDFIWHDHQDTDETLIVIDGSLRIDFRDGTVTLRAGEMFVVPKGVEHKPYAEQEVKLLLIEPRGVLNTGHEGGERTAQNDVWI